MLCEFGELTHELRVLASSFVLLRLVEGDDALELGVARRKDLGLFVVKVRINQFLERLGRFEFEGAVGEVAGRADTRE